MHEELLKVTNELYTVSNKLTCPRLARAARAAQAVSSAGPKCLFGVSGSGGGSLSLLPSCRTASSFLWHCWECCPRCWFLMAAEEDFLADLP